ncbi:MAG: transporter, partial [Hymenobacter sp.]
MVFLSGSTVTHASKYIELFAKKTRKCFLARQQWETVRATPRCVQRNMKCFLLLVAVGLAMSSLAVHAQTSDDNHPQFPCPYDSAHFSWRKPVPRNRLRPLRPDRPGTTESPFTVDAGHFQLEADGVRLINQPASGDDPQQRAWYAADVLLKLGLGRKTDIQVELPLYSAQQQRSADTGDWESHRGFGDVAVRLKHNFLGDDQQGPLAASVVAFVRVPTRTGAVSEARLEYGLILPVNVEVGDTYNLDAQFETDLEYDPE